MAVAQISRSARRREVAGIPGTVPALPGAHRRATRARRLPPRSAAGAAVAGWSAVAVRSARLEYVAKPAVMVALIGAAVALSPAAPAIVPWFVAAVALSLVGDVALMLPRERFVGGLVAFLLAHMAYIVGVGLPAQSVGGVILGLFVVGTVLSTVGRRIFKAVRHGHPGLLAPVAAYMVVISAMDEAAAAPRL